METINLGQCASAQGITPAASVKPHPAWRAAKIVYKTVAGISLAALVVASALMATEGLGTVEALSAQVAPVARITPAAPGISWVQAAPSVMIEAGRTPQGGLDIRQMLQAWQAAGMPSADAARALDLVGQLRPVLMGRQDALAIAEHTAAQVQAAAQLSAEFPQVIANLQSGKVVPALDAEEVVLWNDKIDDLESALAHDVKIQSADAPRSLDDNIQKRLEWNAAHPQIARSLPSVLAMSETATGATATDRVVDLLDRAGASVYMVEDIHGLLLDATKPLQGLPLATSKKQIEEGLEIEEEINHMLEELGLANLHRAATDPRFRAPPLDPDDVVSPAEWQSFRANLAEQAKLATLTSHQPAPVVSMSQARQALEEAVASTGLRSLSPSLWQLRSPQSVMELATNLTTANAELARATGWKGAVLGLDGRMELSMGPITQKDEDISTAVAVVSADRSGRLQMVSDWSSLGHEWFHAFDHVAAREVLVNPSGRPLTENAQLLRATLDPAIKQATRALNESLNDGSPRWQEIREDADDRADRIYFTRGTEVGAYAFAAYLTNTGAKLLGNNPRDIGYLLEPQRMPSAEEREHQEGHFRTLFEATAVLNLAGGNATPKMKSIEQWRASRAKPEIERSEARYRTLR